MDNYKAINEAKKNVLRKFNPTEMESYVKKLIANLYEGYLEQDKDKALASKELIEEATEVFTEEGYYNSFTKELEFRLAKANEVLVETLTEKDNIAIRLSEVIIDNELRTLSFMDLTLTNLLAIHEETPSTELASRMGAINHEVKHELFIVKNLLELTSEYSVIDPTAREQLENHVGKLEDLGNKISLL